MGSNKPEEQIKECEECGATVYSEHLESGIARYEGGRLLCSVCVAEYERAHDTTSDESTDDLAPIEFEDDETDSLSASGEMSSTRIHTVSAATLGGHGAWDDSKFKRELQPNGVGATRCRTFHCRLSEGAIDFLVTQINEWIDGNDKIAVKFVNSSIGLFEGKHTEQNLIVTLFY